MKKFKIKSLELKNFKGGNERVEFNSDRVFIMGTNKVGKTRLIKAFNWLLSGYTDADNTANHELFDNREEISENTPTASVEGTFLIDDEEYKIKRCATAKFERKRGTNEVVKSKSDEYKIFIDDIETSTSSFKTFINDNICPFERITYLLNGEFFYNLSKSDKLSAIHIMQDMVGEITDESLKGDYTLLFEYKKRFSLEQLEEQTDNKIRPLKQKLGERSGIGEIDIKIETKQETISSLKINNYDDIANEISVKKNRINEIDVELNNIASSLTPQLDKQAKELSAISSEKAKLYDMEREFNAKANIEVEEIKNKIDNIERDNKNIIKTNNKAKDNFDSLIKNLGFKQDELARYKENISKLREKIYTEKEKVFSASECHYCGQKLPYDLIEKAQENFSKEKLERINSIQQEGIALKEKIYSLEKEIEAAQGDINIGCEQLPLVSNKDLVERLEVAKNNIPCWTDSEEYKKQMEKIENMEKSITKIEKIDTEKLFIEREELKKILYNLQVVYGGKNTIAILEKEIEDLQLERKANGIELAKLEGLKAQIKNYRDEKAKIASDRINENLIYSKIKTKIKQKDGSYKDVCDIQNLDGIRLSTINMSDKLIIFTDIQRMFCFHYGIMMPIWIDEALTIADERRPIFNDCQTFEIIRTEENFITIKNN